MRNILHLNLMLTLVILLVGCTIYPSSTTLNVFAAASLTNAFIEIKQNFERAYPNVKVALNFASSHTLRMQIEEGAQADIFASANILEMNALIDSGLVSGDAPILFTSNRLTIILPPSNPGGVCSLQDLANPGLKIILAAEDVPAGKYAREVLENLNALYGNDYKVNVISNLVSNELTVRQVVAKILLGEADVGIVYISDAVSTPELPTIQIPTQYNVVAQYPIAPLVNTLRDKYSNIFIKFVLSPESQATLTSWGFESSP